MKIDLSKLVQIEVKEITKESLIFTKETKSWCHRPYAKHPHGCINIGKISCAAPYSESIKNKYNFFYLIYGKFDFKKYKEIKREMWEKEYPNKRITEDGLGNILHWQGSIKRMLKDKIKELYRLELFNKLFLFGSGSGFTTNDDIISFRQDKIYSMESSGIDVFTTLSNNKIPFEYPAQNFILIVCLLCSRDRLRK